MKYIYKFDFLGYAGYGGNSHFFMKNENKYSKEELQKILDSVTSNYKLIIALEMLENTKGIEEFKENFDDKMIQIPHFQNLLIKKNIFKYRSKYVSEILSEYHGFECWDVKYEASAGYTDWDEEEDL